MNPGRKPTAYVTAARYGRKVVKEFEPLFARQPLHQAEREGGAANAAARQTQSEKVLPVKLFANFRKQFFVQLCLAQSRLIGVVSESPIICREFVFAEEVNEFVFHHFVQ